MFETISKILENDCGHVDIKDLKRRARKGNLVATLDLINHYNYNEAYQEALVLEERLAKKGNAALAYSAGEKYLLGLGTKKDYEKARAYFTMARDAGNTDADIQLTVMALCDTMPKPGKCYKKCADKLRDYAGKGYQLAQSALAKLLCSKSRIKPNIPQAWRYYKAAFEEADLESLLETGMFLVRHGEAVGEKPETGFRYVKKAALYGDGEAVLQTGICYMSGFGVKKDLTKAINWFEKLEDDANSTEKDVYLGLAYYERGEAGDGEKALKRFKSAEKKASPAGTFMAIRCVLEGVGTKQNTRLGKSLLRAAAEDGNPLCARQLADWYRDGEMYRKNCKTAATWYRKAYEGGNISAGTELGKLYFSGFGVKKNIHKAFQYFCEAGNAWNLEAQTILENCYREGNEIQKDLSIADDWKAFRMDTLQVARGRYPENWEDLLACEREATRWQKIQQ